MSVYPPANGEKALGGGPNHGRGLMASSTVAASCPGNVTPTHLVELSGAGNVGRLVFEKAGCVQWEHSALGETGTWRHPAGQGRAAQGGPQTGVSIITLVLPCRLYLVVSQVVLYLLASFTCQQLETILWRGDPPRGVRWTRGCEDSALGFICWPASHHCMGSSSCELSYRMKEKCIRAGAIAQRGGRWPCT